MVGNLSWTYKAVRSPGKVVTGLQSSVFTSAEHFPWYLWQLPMRLTGQENGLVVLPAPVADSLT